MSKKNRHIKIGCTAPAKFDFHRAMHTITHNFMAAERELTPLILSKRMEVGESLVLIAMRADAANSGHHPAKHGMTAEDVSAATEVLLELWKKGQFVPSEQFPFTLEQALKDWEALA